MVDANGTDVYTTNVLNQYTEVADANYTYDDAGNMTNDGQYEYVYDAENRLVQVHNIGPLAAACDTDLVLATGGDADWYNQTDEYCAYSDEDAARSGAIGDDEETWMQTVVSGPGTVRFYWKVSSQVGDSVKFYVDDQLKLSRAGDLAWAEGIETITSAGEHTLKWRYSKDSSGSSGDDCAWVDYIQWTGDVPEPNEWQTATYVYDPAGRRIAKAFDGDVAIRYVYDGVHCIAEYDANDVLLRKFLYGPGVDQPICMTEVQDANAVYYYHFDGLGSVVALSDGDGDTVQVYEYSVYGQPAASDPNHPNPFLFTGRRFDPETGLYYYRARMYNPYIGRFLQTDSVGYGMNPYAYCGNNPLGMVDPSGCTEESVTVGYLLNGDVLTALQSTSGTHWNRYSIWYEFGWSPDDLSVGMYDGLPVYTVNDDATQWDNMPEGYHNGWFYEEIAQDDPFYDEVLSGVEFHDDSLWWWVVVYGPLPLPEPPVVEPVYDDSRWWDTIQSNQPPKAGALIVGGLVVGAVDGPSPVADVLYWGSAIYAGVKAADIAGKFLPYGSKKAARKAARKASGGAKKPIHHEPNYETGYKGHYHPKGPGGTKMPDHYQY